MIRKEKILVSESAGNDVSRLFKDDRYEVLSVSTINDFKNKVMKYNPSLIIGDFQKFGKPIGEICRLIKKDEMMRHIPFIVVSDRADLSERIEAADSGVSDYIIKPFEKNEALARINRSIRDMKSALNANPLTRLPGNIAIQDKLESMVCDHLELAVAYFDIDNFKSFNDVYGYAAGDRVISHFASLLLKCRDEISSDEDDFFVGHIGGDDFILICSEENIEGYCKKFIKRFDTMVPYEYDEETAQKGYMLGKDRRGNVSLFPLISVSIAVVINESGDKFSHVGEVASSGAEIKKYLKSHPGSSYLIDRRG